MDEGADDTSGGEAMREETWIGESQLLPSVPSSERTFPPLAVDPARDGPIGEIFDLFVDFFGKQRPVDLKGLIERLERRIIVNVLSKVQGNQKEAARALGLKYTTLNEKVKKYGIRSRRRTAPPSPGSI
jgi:DNA-binding NtrC family response regulator